MGKQHTMSTQNLKVDPDGSIARAIRELKKAADYIAKTGSHLGAARLHRIADEAADEANLEITKVKK